MLERTKSRGSKRTRIFLLGLLISWSVPALAFKPSIHEAITEDALSSYRVRFTDGHDIGLTPTAIDDIRRANVSTDYSLTFLDSSAHFDNEELVAGAQRVSEARTSAINWLTSPSFALLSELSRAGTARIAIGSALHTIQDFYAHSTWVERATAAERLNSTRADFAVIAQLGPSSGLKCANGTTPLGDAALTTGYFSIGPLNELEMQGRVLSGFCIHGLQPTLPPGIHKDDESRSNHPEARHLATLASVEFLDSVIAVLRSTGTELHPPHSDRDAPVRDHHGGLGNTGGCSSETGLRGLSAYEYCAVLLALYGRPLLRRCTLERAIALMDELAGMV